MPSRRAAARGSTVAIVLGAGQGTRMGASQNKVLLPLGGSPLLVHALHAFERVDEIDEIVLVAHPNEVWHCKEEIIHRHDLRKVRQVVAGGNSRHQSEERALEALRPRIESGEVGIVMIHDGARPFLSPDDICRLIAATRLNGAALLVAPLGEDEVIVRFAEDNTVVATYAAATLARAQTPQSSTARELLAAYDAAYRDGFEGTDTASSLERMGYRVAAVLGSLSNIKVTTPDDLLRAEKLLRP